MIPHSKSRPVIVDGVEYRWLISGSGHQCKLIVQRADGTGARLEVAIQLEYEGCYWLPLDDVRGPTSLSNSLVSRLMKAARRAGWTDASGGGAFHYPANRGS